MGGGLDTLFLNLIPPIYPLIFGQGKGAHRHSAPGHPGPRTPRSFGHPGPWTFKSPDIQVFRTFRSFGHTAPWTYKSPDIQVFRTFRSFGHTAPWTNSSPDIQVFRISDFGFSKMYIPQPCARRAHRNPPTYIHPTSVGMIYPILTYIFN